MKNIADWAKALESDLSRIKDLLVAQAAQIASLRANVQTGDVLTRESSDLLDSVLADADTLAATFPAPTPGSLVAAVSGPVPVPSPIPPTAADSQTVNADPAPPVQSGGPVPLSPVMRVEGDDFGVTADPVPAPPADPVPAS